MYNTVTEKQQAEILPSAVISNFGLDLFMKLWYDIRVLKMLE